MTKEDIIKPENLVAKKPTLMNDNPMHYCPGCSHGVVHKLIAEVIEEMGMEDKAIGISPVGCAVFIYNYIDIDWQEAAHGRAPALATAIKKIGDYDIIIGGRQAIDGDTAQVGPQVAEKLGLTQVTYAEEILNVDKAAKKITVKRHIDGGVETVEVPLPIVITVNGSAAPCRPRNAKLVQKYKRALGAQEKAAIEKEGAELPYAALYEKYPYLNITEWSVADVNGDLAQCGLSGSPTKVKTIQNISFQAKESKTLTGSDQDVEDLIVELLANHTIG